MNDNINARRTNECKLAKTLQSPDWIRNLHSIQKRREAIALRDWSFTEHFARTCLRYNLDRYDFGAEPPDFILIGRDKVAVEITRIVTPKKAILDRSPFVSGGYVSTLRRSEPSAEFHQQIQSGSLYPDSSLVRPHVESPIDLDSDYFDLAEARLHAKAESARRIASLYDHIVILLVDELSEFPTTFDRRVRRLREKCSLLGLPCNAALILLMDRLVSGLWYNLANEPL